MTAPTVAPPTGQPSGQPGRPGLPAGTHNMSRTYYDEENRRRTAAKPVPVTEYGRINGVEWQCRKTKRSRWYGLAAKGIPVCDCCGRQMTKLGVKRAPLLPWSDIWSAANRPLRPVWALAGTASAGFVIDAAQIPALPLAVAAPLAGWAATKAARKVLAKPEYAKGRLEHEDPDGDKRLRAAIDRCARTVGYSAAGGVAALAMAAALGLDPSTWVGRIAMAALVAAWLLPAATWWRAERERRNQPEPVVVEAPERPQPQIDEVEAEVRRRWRNKLSFRQGDQVVDDTGRTVAAQRDGRLAGCRLDDWHKLPGGWGGTIVGPIGAFQSEQFEAARGAIASAMSMKKSMITIMPDGEDENLAYIMAQRTSPITDVVRWAGPESIDVAKGTAPLVQYADGELGNYEIYRPGWGVPHVAVFGTTGSGKALALDTPIPTPDGWTTMGALAVGDRVFDENGNVCNVVAATDIMHDRPCYEVEFSDGTVIVADAEHQWRTTTQRGRWQQGNLLRHPNPKRDRTTRRVMLDVEPVTTEQIAATLYAPRGGSQPRAVNHAVDVCGALDYPKRDLSIQPYTLGAWLGDGNSYGATISNPDPEVLEEIRRDGYIVTDHSDGIGHGILTAKFNKGEPRPVGHRSFQALLKDAGLLLNKHIPEEYLRSSIGQRRALLAGLLDTDGTCAPSGVVSLALCHERLARDAFDLVLGLGFKATMRTKRVKGRTEATSTCYTIAFTAHEPVFRFPRKGDRQRPVPVTSTSRRRYIVDVRSIESVPVRCIQVDSPRHMYLASRACVPTHNSELLNGLFTIDRWAHYVDDHGQKRGIVANFLIDPQQGQSFAPFLDSLAAPVATTLAEATLLVEALTAEMLRRNRYLARVEYRDERGRKRRGRKWWNPLTDGPILSLTIDEAHAFLIDKAFGGMVTAAGRMWRKCGGQLRIATHTPLLTDLGGSMALRDMLTGGYVWVGRTANSLSGPTAFNGRLPVDPRTIPQVPGMAYVLAGADPKPMLSRAMWEPDYYDWVFDADDNPIGYPAVLPRITLDTFGQEYAAWVTATTTEPGSWTPEEKTALKKPAVGGKAVDAVLAVLAAASTAMDMDEIDAALNGAGTPFATRTVREALKVLRDERGLVFSSKGRHELTPQARDEDQAVRTEQQALFDAEAGE
ncbi:hypothetical protein Drose_06010 [Dactylosporangium roseum]|uniref:DOD-type homing endonuclease domain-containing protein n=1 Tax=Dactylosporangium roseum TaxID=47989 RepID=A0ABY5Z717_9ACTN|nr:hypothetical protein [Dactylosporangium roseum]UWZ37826.1 hypothetical protein Drose_06010 [Dactylosporangium roseum]